MSSKRLSVGSVYRKSEDIRAVEERGLDLSCDVGSGGENSLWLDFELKFSLINFKGQDGGVSVRYDNRESDLRGQHLIELRWHNKFDVMIGLSFH